MFQLHHQTVLEGKQLGCQTVFDFEPPAANWFGVQTLVRKHFDIQLQHQSVLEVKPFWKSKLGCQSALDFETPAANWFGVKTWVPNCFDIELQHQAVLEVKRKRRTQN